MNDFLKAAAERFSVRKFKDIPVEDEKINAILEAARLAPTACNYQPQKIYVIRDTVKAVHHREKQVLSGYFPPILHKKSRICVSIPEILLYCLSKKFLAQNCGAS